METFEASGLQIFLESRFVSRGQTWEAPIRPGIWLGILLAGSVDIERSDGASTTWRRGSSDLFLSERESESRHRVLADGNLSGVFVHIPIEDAEPVLSEAGLRSLQQGSPAPKPDPTILSGLAWQMLGCSLTGPARRLQMMGKAMEILAEALKDVDPRDAGAGQGATRAWSARDVERLHEARALLLTDLKVPPALPELARRVGLGLRSFSAGFYDLFGQPPYAYLKQKRLEAGHRMLEAGETSVGRVAGSIGYHPNHFSTEFRKRFGYSPTEMLASAKHSSSRTVPDA